MLFEYFACEWVARKRCVEAEMERPPFLTPLAGASVAHAVGHNMVHPRAANCHARLAKFFE
jgi:hypothetical protein